MQHGFPTFIDWSNKFILDKGLVYVDSCWFFFKTAFGGWISEKVNEILVHYNVPQIFALS